MEGEYYQAEFNNDLLPQQA
jgi:hypothetical protein